MKKTQTIKNSQTNPKIKIKKRKFINQQQIKKNKKKIKIKIKIKLYNKKVIQSNKNKAAQLSVRVKFKKTKKRIYRLKFLSQRSQLMPKT